MALPLQASAMWRTLRRPQAPALGIAMNSAALPLFTWLWVSAGGAALLGPELSIGLLVAAATPCTLASAAVWTRRAGGNDSASIMVTVITNASCFLVTPFWLLVTTGQTAELDAGGMIAKLFLLVVLPMSLAQLIRRRASFGAWATRHKTPLGVFAQTGVLTMIFIGSVQTGERFSSASTRPGGFELFLVLFSVATIHLTILGAGTWIARLLGMEREDQISVAFAGSQKTLMVGLQVAIDLGFNIVPMVLYHITQLLLDTLIADRFKQNTQSATSDTQEGSENGGSEGERAAE
jgi:sodium/bile acid cotransporter 7